MEGLTNPSPPALPSGHLCLVQEGQAGQGLHLGGWSWPLPG